MASPALEKQLRLYARDFRKLADRDRRKAQELESAYQQVLRSAAEITALIEATPCALIELDDQHRIQRWNKRAKEIFSLEDEDLAEGVLEDCPISWELTEVESLLQAVGERGDSKSEIEFSRPDKSQGVLSLRVSRIPQHGGFVIMATDITDQQMLERRAREMRKLEALGQLAAGVAHEINTPTQFIGDNLHFLRESTQSLLGLVSRLTEIQDAGLSGSERACAAALEEADFDYLREELPEAIAQSLKGIDHIASIVKAMRAFSHPGSAQMKPVDLNKCLKDCLAVSRSIWKHTAKVEEHLTPDLNLVRAAHEEISQAFLNILINAAQAIEAADRKGSGVITVASFNEPQSVRIEIADNGCGIPEEVKERIFDPFFTTKEVGQGTGQGLSIACNIVVSKHEGTLTFESVEGKGTTFLIRLPVDSKREQPG